ncbi:MAG: alkaline phosphatase family protein [Anaerolineae bacterium]
MLQLNPTFVKPTYDGRSFTAVPASIAGLLGRGPIALAPETLAGLPARYRAVVLILADGFGWRFFEQYADTPALRRFVDQGTVTKITSQFPSTTTAHVTCLHTGLEVGQSGLHEWQYYEPQLDALIIPLLFSWAGTKERDQLKAAGVDPARLYPPRTLYPDLAAAGISSYIFSHREYTPSTYSNAMYRGATAVRGCLTLAEALVNLRHAVATAAGPAYFIFYFDRLDGIAHEYGPNSPQLEAEFDAFLTVLERQFLARLGGRGDVLVLMLADHGEVETDPATTIYLNTDPAFAGIERYLMRNRKGELLVAAGSPRDFFLYVRDELLDEAQAFLAQRLAGRADVVRTADLVAAGFFGVEPPSPAFLARVGNLVILPYRGEAVWWYEKDRFEQRFYGHHGGLTPEEMAIPLLLAAF